MNYEFDASIIIRTLNEGYYLPSLLTQINKQKTSYTYEIILVDSGSEDNTLTTADHYHCRIFHIKRKDFSFGRSLNLGCKNAKGKFLVIVSGHCIPYDENWLQNLIKPLDKKIVAYTYGRQIGGRKTFWSENQIFKKYYGKKSKIPQIGFFCNNANSAILKTVWDKNQFNENITGLEDLELAKRISNKGLRIGYVADSSVYHLHNETWAQVEKRFLREALAMKYIFPEILITPIYSIYCLFIAIVSDLYNCLLDKKNIFYLINIFRYRYFQYLGSYKGNKQIRLINSRLRDSFYYPTDNNLGRIRDNFYYPTDKNFNE